MTNTETVDAELKNVNQEGACNQVKDDAQATQNTEVLPPSSSISSDYAAKYLNFDNIPLVDIEVVSMLDINVQQKFRYLGTRLDDAFYKVLKKHDVDIINEHSVSAEIVEKLRQQYVPKKSTKDIKKLRWSMQESSSPKQRALYHALMESIVEDEDAMDEGVAEKFKKRKPNDVDKDKGPSVGSDQGLKRPKSSKDIEPSNKGKSTESSKGTSKSQPKSIAKSAQAEETVFQPKVKATPKHDWFKKPERPLVCNGYSQKDKNEAKTKHENRKSVKSQSQSQSQKVKVDAKDVKIAQAEKTPLSFDEIMSTPIDFLAYVMNHLKIDNLTQQHLVGPAFNLLKGTCKSRVELEYNFEEFDYGTRSSIVPVDFFFNNDLEYLKGGSSSKKYTTSTTKTKAAKHDIPGIEDMVPSL
ncbi:hypothetical protein Tco_1320770 [Tanacetum coccineum]